MTLSPDSPIYVAGHAGMVGSALVKGLRASGHRNLVVCTSTELDLRDQAAVHDFLATTRPTQVYLAAASLARMVAQTMGFEGQIFWDDSKPDGTSRKWLDVSRLAELGWTSTISLEEGLRTTYEDFLAAQASNALRC